MQLEVVQASKAKLAGWGKVLLADKRDLEILLREKQAEIDELKLGVRSWVSKWINDAACDLQNVSVPETII